VTDIIERVPALSNVSPANQRLLRQCAPQRVLARRTQIILHKGQPVSGAYFVLAGKLRVFTVAPNGTEATLYFVGPGETCVLALNSLFNNLLYPAWVEGNPGSQLVVVPGAVYRRLFDTEPAVRDLTLNAQSTLVYRLMQELEHVHSSNFRQRLAQYILLHADTDGRLCTTQQQLARHLGTSREVVARLVSEMASRGLLRSGRGYVGIKDLFGLRAIVLPRGRLSGARARAPR
jgi:CRP/FNR family transcriptional regulator